HVLPEPDPDPRDLALPRVCGRPGLGAAHRRARAPDERATEDLERDVPDPATRPPRGRVDECVLHRPGKRQAAHGDTVRDTSAARAAAGAPGRDLARDGPADRGLGFLSSRSMTSIFNQEP